MKMYKIPLLAGLACMIGLMACEDVVNIETDPPVSQLVIDAWLNNRSLPQTIRLTQSIPYFDQAFSPGVSGAEVALVDMGTGRAVSFIDQGNGDYTWTPQPGDSLGTPGTGWQLEIQQGEQEYQANTAIFRTTPIDSITWEFRDDEIGGADGLYAQFFARDRNGLGDTYWIKAYKNGQFLNKPQEMNLAFDAGFDAGAEVDGIIFITPIREAINPIPDPDTEEEDLPPYAEGDTIRVEIHSLSPEAHAFLSLARDQMTNGDNTIFAIPLANTKTNIQALSGEDPLGFFNIAAVSSLEVVVTE